MSNIEYIIWVMNFMHGKNQRRECFSCVSNSRLPMFKEKRELLEEAQEKISDGNWHNLVRFAWYNAAHHLTLLKIVCNPSPLQLGAFWEFGDVAITDEQRCNGATSWAGASLSSKETPGATITTRKTSRGSCSSNYLIVYNIYCQ